MGVLDIVRSGRRLVATTFLDAAIIGDRTLSSDGAGGQLETWTDRPGTQPCRFVTRQMGMQTDADPRPVAGEFSSPEGAAVLFPVGVVLDEGDRIVNAANGHKWIVVGERTPDSTLQVVVRVIVREMDAGI